MPIYGENPFCSKRIKPGAIPFYFPEGITMDTLLEFLVLNGWCGQIIGPHGSGKSTLLAALVPRIREVGRTFSISSYKTEQNSSPSTIRSWKRWIPIPYSRLTVSNNFLFGSEEKSKIVPQPNISVPLLSRMNLTTIPICIKPRTIWMSRRCW